MTKNGNIENGKRYNPNIATAINAIVVMYVILKLVFYIFFVEGDHWITRFFSGIITLAIVIPINNPRISNHVRAILVPFTIAFVESIVCVLVDGDRLYFMLLVGSVAMSLIFADYTGLLIHIGLTYAISIIFTCVFRFNMLGTAYDMNDVLINFFGFTVCNIILYVICTFSVGQYKRHESSSDTFATIMETTPSYMVVINEKTKVQYISSSLIDWLGLDDVRYAINRPLLDLFASYDIKMMFQEVMESKGFIEKDFELTVNGNKCWFMLRSTPMSSNKVARFFEWVDITQVMEAKNEAIVATKAKSEFLAKMSHEIRTPMNAITGMSELILRENIPPIIRDHAMEIKNAGNNLLAIINDILDISKIESGKLDIILAEYIFSSLIHDVISIIRARINEKPILFTANIDCNLPNNMIGDEVRLRQILLNILGNAAKYTNEGFISLTISGAVEGDTVWLTIEIADSGVGMKEEDIPKLFATFMQLDTLKNKGIVGSGLGLSITKNLCAAMGGDISVSSRYGEGSIFTITIPQRFNAYEKLAHVETPEKKRLLIYEPRSVYADSITRTADNLGVPCVAVTNRSRFYEELERESYPFVFVPSFLLGNARDALARFNLHSTLVMLAELGEAQQAQNVKTIAIPAHSISIANLLNNVADNIKYREGEKINVRFTAPSARVLIVDDINTNLRVAEGLMLPYKMQIDTCASGQEAIALVQKNRYDIIFMDHMMPGMDGLEATNIIRALEDESGYYKKVPIIALTANAVIGVKETFLQNGLNDFLAKPVEISKLNNLLEKWVPHEKRERHEYDEKRAASSPIDIEIEGVDVMAGIAITGGTVENYLEILDVFQEDGWVKINELRICMEKNDIKLYTIIVHALKSAAAGIGANQVSEFAKTLEMAGKTESLECIGENTESFIKELEMLLLNIKAAIIDKR